MVCAKTCSWASWQSRSELCRGLQLQPLLVCHVGVKSVSFIFLLSFLSAAPFLQALHTQMHTEFGAAGECLVFEGSKKAVAPKKAALCVLVLSECAQLHPGS